MNLLPDSLDTLGTDVGVRCGRRAVLTRKHVPLAAIEQDMKSAIENHLQIDDPGSSIGLGAWKQGFKDSLTHASCGLTRTASCPRPIEYSFSVNYSWSRHDRRACCRVASRDSRPAANPLGTLAAKQHRTALFESLGLIEGAC